MSPRVARRLRVAVAWRRAARGVALPSGLSVGIRRGTLEVEVESSADADSVREILPGLANRLVAVDRGLRVRRCRLLVDGVAEPAVPVRTAEEEVPADDERRVSAETGATVEATGGPGEQESRKQAAPPLSALMERYLDRGRGGS